MDLSYPIGKFVKPEVITPEMKDNYINSISEFPKRMREAVASLTNAQLDTPYRPEGWTIRQLVNHCSDSHMNALIRFKLALTEDKPTITPYLQDQWARLADSVSMPVEPALAILDGLHARWTVLLKSMSEQDYSKIYIHPEHGREFTLMNALASYAWHSNHHLAHVVNCRQRLGWN